MKHKNNGNMLDIRVLNRYIQMILHLLCVRRTSKSPQAKLCLYMKRIVHPFTVLMHLALLYNITILFRDPNQVITDESKTRLSSGLTSISSVVIWYIVCIRGKDIHTLLKHWHSHFVRNKHQMNFAITYEEKVLFLLILFCFLGPLIFAIYYSLKSDVDISIYTNFWFLGYAMEDIGFWERFAIFLCVYFYVAEQTLFPGVFLLLFCVLALHLGREIKDLKLSIGKNSNWDSYFLQQLEKHRQIMLQIRNHEKVLSLPIAILVSFFIMIGYTGFALVISRFHVPQNLVAFEALLYFYISAIGLMSVTYTSSRIPLQLQEINDVYRDIYERAIETNATTMNNKKQKRKLMKLKLIYERPIPHLTAWNMFNLDRKLAVTSFGVLFTYGLLIMQVRKGGV